MPADLSKQFPGWDIIDDDGDTFCVAKNFKIDSNNHFYKKEISQADATDPAAVDEIRIYINNDGVDDGFSVFGWLQEDGGPVSGPDPLFRSPSTSRDNALNELRKMTGLIDKYFGVKTNLQLGKHNDEEKCTCGTMKDVGQPCWRCGAGDPKVTPTGIRLDKPTYGDRRHLEEINKKYKPQIENLEKKKMKVEDPWERHSYKLVRQAIKTIKLAGGPKFSDKVWVMLLAEAIKSFDQGLGERIDSENRRASVDFTDIIGNDILKVIAFTTIACHPRTAISYAAYLHDMLVAAWDKYEYDYTPKIGLEYARDSAKKTLMDLHQKISGGDTNARNSASTAVGLYEWLLKPSTESNWLQIHYAAWPEYHLDPVWQDPEAEQQQRVEQESAKPTFEQSYSELRDIAKSPPVSEPPAPIEPAKTGPSRPEFAQGVEGKVQVWDSKRDKDPERTQKFLAGPGDRVKNFSLPEGEGAVGETGSKAWNEGTIEKVTPDGTIVVNTAKGVQEWNPNVEHIEIDVNDRAKYLGRG